MNKKCVPVLALLLAAMPTFACFADSYSEEYVETINGVRFEFGQRLKNLKEQIDMGVTKGWITNAQASELNAEHDRLWQLKKNAKAAGWPKDQVDQLEKGVTAFNAKVSSTLSKPAAKPAAPAAEVAPVKPVEAAPAASTAKRKAPAKKAAAKSTKKSK